MSAAALSALPPAGELALAGLFGLAALAALRRARQQPDPGPRRFWAVLALLMAGLALNKPLDLQTALTDLGRGLARAEGWWGGWYASRRTVQAGFVIALAGLAGIGLAAGLAGLRGRLAAHAPALAGLALALVFVLGRAAQIHHLAGPEATPWLRGAELLAPLLVLAGALRRPAVPG